MAGFLLYIASMALINIAHLTLNVHVQDSPTLAKVLAELKHNSQQLNKIIMTNAELKAALEAANTKLDKVTTEVQTLADAVASNGNVPEDIAALVTSLNEKLQAVDDINADAPAEEPTPGEGEPNTPPSGSEG